MNFTLVFFAIVALVPARSDVANTKFYFVNNVSIKSKRKKKSINDKDKGWEPQVGDSRLPSWPSVTAAVIKTDIVTPSSAGLN